jgi:Tol biopolymer transport system component
MQRKPGVVRSASGSSLPQHRWSLVSNHGMRAVVALGLFAMVVVQTQSTPNAAFPGVNGKVAFTSDRNGLPQIFVMDADGSNQTPVTVDRGYDARWSPDGTRIAFASDRSGFNEVYVIDADGSDETQLAGSPGQQDRSPSWSPDGTQIAFFSTRSGSGEVWVMSADGSSPDNRTGGLGGGQPAWSPDGSRIAFTSNRDGNSEIYLVRRTNVCRLKRAEG